ncbi:toll-like receptor 13 [Labrus mixtus]|uniref:toll-like receptor 13 n=1 Tax=Labrus mixtus TaxID=508554 RepID=UPI0029C0FC4D|nr:toll-like receptor 13 [Labrus mixtus]XP_060920747.1 toll-like receptor 13 [Labrus mixtus]
MGPEMKEDKTKTEARSTSFEVRFIVLLLCFISTVEPVAGFALRDCRISNNSAICKPVDGKISVVPRDIPSTVKSIDLSSNNITKILMSDFRKKSVLTELDLKGNKIVQIDPRAFADLISLKKLNLNSNKLVKLGDDIFVGLSNVTELRITHNRIKAVPPTSFESLTSLTFLDISHNKLHSSKNVHSLLQQLPNLQSLVITNNDLTHFQSWELTNSSLELASLDLSQNPIAVFRITADVFPNLTWLNIGSTIKNKMIWDIRNTTFLSRVSTLDISGLQLVSDDWKTFLETFNSSLKILRMNQMKHDLTELISISCTIPTITTLQLRQNKLSTIHSDLFSPCIHVTELDLSDNSIQKIQDEAFVSLKGLRDLSLGRNKLPSVPAATRNLKILSKLDLSTNKISSLGCNDFANLTKLRQLNLYQNPIPTLNEFVFKDLIGLQVLKLQSCQLSRLNKAFNNYLPNLRQLHLNGNKLTIIKKGELNGLKSLQNLSLHDNQIKVLQNGSFIGLTNLTNLLLQSNNIQTNSLKQNWFTGLTNLKRLDLRDNHISYANSLALPDPPFSKLTHLETLAIPSQHHRGKSCLPRNLLEGLTNLLSFDAHSNQILSVHKDMFKHTPRLQMLDISSNELTDLTPDLFSPIQNLKSLYISRISLRSLDFLINAKLTELEFLQARKNIFPLVSQEQINSLPALVYLDLFGQSFKCDCDNAEFLNWTVKNTQTQVFDAYNFKCNYPPSLNNTKLLDLDIRSCSVNIEFNCFISTTCLTLLFMMVSFTYHFLRLQLVYAYYVFLAFLFDSKHKNMQASDQYDAFISYNAHDEPWVINELLPKLENEQGWRLCLHHRDFEPGKPIMENIADAIYGSRKTICVISQRYLESEWCSREMTLASFRLFDEQKDVLILVFLEEIPAAQLSPYYRMRKLLKRQTYLSWPRAEENTNLFWEKLRQALKTREDHGEDRFLLKVVDQP